MNIVVVNHYAGSPMHGMEHRPYHLARAWSRLGHHVTIVAGSFSHLRARNPDVSGPVTVQDLDGIRYVWLRTPPYEGNGVRRVASMGVFVARLYASLGLIGSPNPDVVIASSTYPFDVLPAVRLARRTGARFVYEVHDLWPLTPRLLGGYSKRHPFIAAMQAAEDVGYRTADAVVSLLPGTLSYMQSRGLDPRRFVWIPNGQVPMRDAPSVPLPDEPHRRVLRQLRADLAFIVGYAGGHGVSNSLDVLLAAAERLRGQPVCFVLLGDGPEKPRLVHEAQRRALERVIFLPRVPPGAVPEFLEAVDVAYLGWHDSPLYQFGISPNKLLDYMSAGLPIIHAVRAFNDPVVDAGCGISVAPGDDSAIAAAIQRMRGMNTAERAAMGERGNRYVREHLDYSVLAQRFLTFVTDPALGRHPSTTHRR